MKLSDLISIVMPVKNAGAYLEECLDSILNQFETNWELIVVNDHSIDKSEHILQTYANSDQRISYFNNTGDGIIPALQTAYSHASGNMIHRMDADDVMPPHKLKQLRTKLQEVGAGHVVTGKVEYFAESEVSNGYRKYEQWLNQLCEADSHWLSIYKECVIASPAWLIFRDDFEKCGGFDSIIYPEDYDLVFRFYKAGYKVESVDEVVHLWRDHSSRTSRNHPNYQQNAFFSIKLHYFFELDRDFFRPLVVWGAGPKGKIMAKLLKRRNEKFIWACNNPNKKGHDIYDKTMRSIGEIMKLPEPQILITVAQRNAQKEIRKYLTAHGLEEYKDYYFFR